MRRDFNLKSFWGRKYAFFYALTVEHHFINYLRNNFHQVSNEAYRSAQPTMGQIKKWQKKYGIKTIVNLKGENPAGAYFYFEKEQCEKLGIKLVNVGIKSRGIPQEWRIEKAKEVFATVEYPILMHCKAGADRAGVYSTLYQYFRQNIPIEKTNQLKFWPYGHIKYSKAGKIDFYFNTFIEYKKENPKTEFYNWSQNIANRDEIEKNFKTNKLADFINDKILRRE